MSVSDSVAERLKALGEAIGNQLAAGNRVPADAFWQAYLGTVSDELAAIRAEVVSISNALRRAAHDDDCEEGCFPTDVEHDEAVGLADSLAPEEK
jgi:hypothetical protein